jgi:hypothetical protein
LAKRIALEATCEGNVPESQNKETCMNSHDPHLLSRALLIGFASACISACSGGGDAPGAEGSGIEARAEVGVMESFSTLLADDGSIMPSAPDTVPADAAARTRAGRYASSHQAAELERALGDGVIRVNVECCGPERVDEAVGIAYGVQAAADLAYSAPVLVHAADLRLGAVAVNRLSDAGYSSIWLVTR